MEVFMLNTDAQIIGIHNQDPLALFVQFSVGEHYYIYERDCVTKSESIKEELFEEKSYGRKNLNRMEEQLLQGKIMFIPKIKRVVKDYPF